MSDLEKEIQKAVEQGKEALERGGNCVLLDSLEKQGHALFLIVAALASIAFRKSLPQEERDGMLFDFFRSLESNEVMMLFDVITIMTESPIKAFLMMQKLRGDCKWTPADYEYFERFLSKGVSKVAIERMEMRLRYPMKKEEKEHLEKSLEKSRQDLEETESGTDDPKGEKARTRKLQSMLDERRRTLEKERRKRAH